MLADTSWDVENIPINVLNQHQTQDRANSFIILMCESADEPVVLIPVVVSAVQYWIILIR